MAKKLNNILLPLTLAGLLTVSVLTGCATTSRNYSPTMDNPQKQEYFQEKKESYNLESYINFFGKLVAPFWAVARFWF